MTKKIIFVLCILSIVILTSCEAVNFDVKNMLSAPSFYADQKEIYNALTDCENKDNITLKYPKRGENRHPYIIENIDNEPGDEALVFYTGNSTENNIKKINGSEDNVRIAILKKDDDDEWERIKDYAGDGREIDKVFILKENDKTYIIVGYCEISSEGINYEKKLSVYSYYDNDLKSIEVKNKNYYDMETIDFDSDGNNEIIAIMKKNDEGEKITTKAVQLKIDEDNTLKEISSVDLLDNFMNITITKGKTYDGKNALYCDGQYKSDDYRSYVSVKKGNSMVMYGDRGNRETTQILLYEDSKLKKVDMRYTNLDDVYSEYSSFNQFEEGNYIWLREAYETIDIDDDGVMEIPTTYTTNGVLDHDEVLYKTDWFCYDGDNSEFILKCSGYYSYKYGYALMFPNRWADSVEIKRSKNRNNAVLNEVVFFKPKLTDKMTLNEYSDDFMKIAVVMSDEADKFKESGYKEITSFGNVEYLYKIEDESNIFSLTKDEIENNFYLVTPKIK